MTKIINAGGCVHCVDDKNLDRFLSKGWKRVDEVEKSASQPKKTTTKKK